MLWGKANDSQREECTLKTIGWSKACAKRLLAWLKKMANVLAVHIQILNEHVHPWNLPHRLAVYSS